MTAAQTNQIEPNRSLYASASHGLLRHQSIIPYLCEGLATVSIGALIVAADARGTVGTWPIRVIHGGDPVVVPCTRQDPLQKQSYQPQTHGQMDTP